MKQEERAQNHPFARTHCAPATWPSSSQSPSSRTSFGLEGFGQAVTPFGLWVFRRVWGLPPTLQDQICEAFGNRSLPFSILVAATSSLRQPLIPVYVFVDFCSHALLSESWSLPEVCFLMRSFGLFSFRFRVVATGDPLWTLRSFVPRTIESFGTQLIIFGFRGSWNSVTPVRSSVFRRPLQQVPPPRAWVCHLPLLELWGCFEAFGTTTHSI